MNTQPLTDERPHALTCQYTATGYPCRMRAVYRARLSDPADDPQRFGYYCEYHFSRVGRRLYEMWQEEHGV